MVLYFVIFTLDMSNTTNKRALTNGFCAATIESRLDNFKKYSKSIPWRRWEKVTVVMIKLVQQWHYHEELIEIVQLCSFGVKNAGSALLSRAKCKNYQALPKAVKEVLESNNVKSADDYKVVKDNLKLTVHCSDPLPPREYWRLFCITCKRDKHLLPNLLSKHSVAIGENAMVVSLINNWDALKISEDHLDFVGCFLPWDKEYKAFPNSRRFIRECREHVKMHTVKVVATKHPQSLLTSAAATNTSTAKKATMMTAAKATDNPTSSSSQAVLKKQPRTKAKVQTKMFQYSTSVNLKGKTKNPHEDFGKKFCLSMVHVGARNMESNNNTIRNYEVGLSGLRAFKEYCESQTSEPCCPVVGVTLNAHNISDAQRAILDSHRYDDPNSLLNQVKNSPFWSITHDNISKFGTEYNGVLLRGINAELDPVHAPYALHKMKGGVDAHATADDIIRVCAEFSPVKCSAYETILSHLQLEDEEIPSAVPDYFKLGPILTVDPDDKIIEIQLSENLPVANAGDGVSVNIKAARVLLQLYGFNSPDFRCAAHIASGSSKRLATSKTMNVQEVTDVYETVRTITQHFELSIKNREALNQAMEILELQPLHLVSWCQTRMAHFLTTCKLFSDSLVPLYDVMYTKNIKKESRDILFTPMNIYCVLLMSSLNDTFMPRFLKAVGKSDLLVSQVYNIARSMSSNVKSLRTDEADKFPAHSPSMPMAIYMQHLISKKMSMT